MVKKPDSGKPELKPETQLVTGGRDPFSYHGFVNPPVHHASTVLYRNADDMLASRGRYHYGRRGTPTSEALEQAMAEIEGPACAGVALAPSGLAAISSALLSAASAGDHILVSDSVYEPTRVLCNTVLKRLGIETTYYDPLVGADIAKLFKPNTRLVFTEAPGSQSFEMQDVPAIAAAAHAKGALVAMDNTWATPLYFRALDFGVDLSIQAGTKYIAGHADVMIGMVAAIARSLAATAQDRRHARALRRAGRHLSHAARFADARRAARAPSGIRAEDRALDAAAAGSRARALSAAGKRSRPCALEAGFLRRLRTICAWC